MMLRESERPAIPNFLGTPRESLFLRQARDGFLVTLDGGFYQGEMHALVSSGLVGLVLGWEFYPKDGVEGNARPLGSEEGLDWQLVLFMVI